IPYPPTDTKIVPYHAQRARLLAIAAHAARTAAQLQGLFTPTALQAALQTVAGAASAPADPAAFCGMPASAPAPSAPAPEAMGVPVECNSTARPSTDLPAPGLAAGLQPASCPTTAPATTADATTADSPVAFCGMLASASPLPRTGEGLGVGGTISPPADSSLPMREAS
ncbi:MAG TPA: hypothetical protein VIG30_10785, partial [Ktedonobacterales bacterium]